MNVGEIGGAGRAWLISQRRVMNLAESIRLSGNAGDPLPKPGAAGRLRRANRGPGLRAQISPTPNPTPARRWRRGFGGARGGRDRLSCGEWRI